MKNFKKCNAQSASTRRKLSRRTALLVLGVTVLAVVAVTATLFLNRPKDEAAIPLSSYDINLDIDADTPLIHGAQSVVFRNRTDKDIDTLYFNLYPYAYCGGSRLPSSDEDFPFAYPLGITYATFGIDGVWTEGTFEVLRSERLLVVNLAQAVRPQGEVKVDMTYTLSLGYNTLRMGFNETALSLTGFYPQLCAYASAEWRHADFSPYGDPIMSDCADYSVSFNLDDEYDYVCSGVSRRDEGIVTARADGIRDFALIISPTMHRYEDSWEGKPLYYLCDGAHEAATTFSHMKRALSCFQELFGNYPYSSFALADVDFAAGGMEYGSLVTVNKSLEGGMRESVVAHETAHQWWYGKVGSDPFVNAWQDEGLCEISVKLYFDFYDMSSYADAYVRRAREEYETFAATMDKLGENIRGTLTLNLGDVKSNAHYACVAYDKALCVFEFAENLMGSNNFTAALKDYADAQKGKIASSEQLFAALDAHMNGVSGALKGRISNT